MSTTYVFDLSFCPTSSIRQGNKKLRYREKRTNSTSLVLEPKVFRMKTNRTSTQAGGHRGILSLTPFAPLSLGLSRGPPNVVDDTIVDSKSGENRSWTKEPKRHENDLMCSRYTIALPLEIYTAFNRFVTSWSHCTTIELDESHLVEFSRDRFFCELRVWFFLLFRAL